MYIILNVAYVDISPPNPSVNIKIIYRIKDWFGK